MIQLISHASRSFALPRDPAVHGEKEHRTRERERVAQTCLKTVTPKVTSLVKHVVFPDTQVNKINFSITFGLIVVFFCFRLGMKLVFLSQCDINNNQSCSFWTERCSRIVCLFRFCLQANVFTPLGFDRMLRIFCSYVTNK